MPVVLSVGQCGSDDWRIGRALGAVGAEVDRASSAMDARAKMSQKSYDLVLVNRILDYDGGSGLEFIRQLKVEEGLLTPVMLVSDYEDAQAAAVALGARPGFGKSELSDQGVLERIKQAIG